MGTTLLFLGCLVFAANIFSLLFSKKKIPDVLLLMLIGILIGPVLQIITTADFGKIGPVMTTVTLVFVLFNGGLDIKGEDLRKSLRSTLTLSFASIFLTVIIIALVGYLYHLSLLNSFILAFILCGIAATVVIPMTDYVKIGKSTKTTLILESALSDVVCLILSLALIDVARLDTTLNVGKIVGNIVSSFLIAALISLFGAMLWAIIIKRIRTLKNSMFLITAYVFIIYGITEILGYSGPIAALMLGIYIANIKDLHRKLFKRLKISENPMLNDGEKNFNSEIGFLLRTTFFVYIGISIPLDNVNTLWIGAVITILLILQRTFVAKHFAPKEANSYDRTIIATSVQKGLASAVLASLPLQYGIEGGEIIQSITFSVILISIVISSFFVLLTEKSIRFNLIMRRYFTFTPKKAKKISNKLSAKIKEKVDKTKISSFFSDDDEQEEK